MSGDKKEYRLGSAEMISAPGMVRWAINGAKASESCRGPALVTRASGRQPVSASRWILLVSPPRDRPSPSRFL